MSKSILVIETPSACVDCPCHFENIYSDDNIYCGAEGKTLLADDIQTFKPDWCPLKEVPQKIAKENRLFIKDYKVGFNACIDKILKERGEL